MSHKICYLSSEITPFASAYSLGNFSRKITSLYHEDPDLDIRLMMPKYGFISERKYILREVIRLKEVSVNFSNKEQIMSIKSAFIPNTRVQVYFVLDDKSFSNTNQFIYKSKNGQFIKNNFEKYSLFCSTILESFKKLFWYPDIIICNDWQTSILPILLNEKYSDNDNYNKIKTINFIHSISNQSKLSSNSLSGFDLKLKYSKNMDMISESMPFFDLNILLDSKKKTNFSKIKSSKKMASNYKKSKTKILEYPQDLDSWKTFINKVLPLFDKL